MPKSETMPNGNQEKDPETYERAPLSRARKEGTSPSEPEPRLVLCAAVSPNADFETRVIAAESAHFDAITLFPQQYLNARKREGLSIPEMRRILSEHGISVAAIDPLLDWFGDRASPSERLMYEVADALDAPAINAAPAFAPELAQGELTDAYGRLCMRAAQHRIRVDLEFLPWTVIPDYRVAFDIIAGSDQDNSGLTLDCMHFYRSGGTPADLAALDPALARRITNIQLCDIPAQPAYLNLRRRLTANKELLIGAWDGIRVMGLRRVTEIASRAHSTRPDAQILMREAICSRLLPGEGDVPLWDIFKSLHALDVHPEIGLEIFSLELNRLAARDAANKAMAAYRELVD
jgi:sugar phosphate isomerase/epimerase